MVRVDRGAGQGWEISRLARSEPGAMSRQAREARSAASGTSGAPATAVSPQGGATIQGNNNTYHESVEAGRDLVDHAADTVVINGNNNIFSTSSQAGRDIIDNAADTIIIDGNNNIFHASNQAGRDIIDNAADTIIIRGNNNIFHASNQAGRDIVDNAADTIIIEGNNNVFGASGASSGDLVDSTSDTIIIRGNNNRFNDEVGAGDHAAPDRNGQAQFRGLVERIHPEPVTLDATVGDEISRKLAEASEYVEAFREFLERHLRRDLDPSRPAVVSSRNQHEIEAYLAARDGHGLKWGHVKKLREE